MNAKQPPPKKTNARLPKEDRSPKPGRPRPPKPKVKKQQPKTLDRRTLPHPAESKEMKLCGAKRPNANGETCKQPAGARTNHPGFGHCWRHGGNSATGIKHAEKEMVMTRMANESKMYGQHRDIGPQEALLEEVQRTAGHVMWLEHKIATFEKDQDLVQYTGKDGMKQSEWVAMYQEERKMLVSVCNTAIRCGIAERQVKIVEEQGRMIAAMMMKFINDITLDLTPQQRLYAPKLARNLLLEMSHPEPDSGKRIIGTDVIDVEEVVEVEHT